MNSGKLSRRQSWAKSLIKLRERCNDYPYGTTNTDYLVIVKVVQNLSYCTRSLVGYREVTRTKTTYECFIMPQEEGASAPQISATYDYDVFINHCNYVVPNIARTRNHAIVVSIRNSASA